MGKLMYKKGTKIKGVINFDVVECKIKSKPEKLRLYLYLRGITRVFKLRALDNKDF